MSAIVKVGRRYTIVIPKEIRKKVKLKEHSRVLMRVSRNRIILEILPNDPFKVLEKTIGEPYREEVDEKKAIEWLMRSARS